MDLLPWYSGLKTGIEAIDKDHKVLVDLLNSLNVAYRESHGRAIFFKSLVALKDETSLHFAREEILMQGEDYPHLDFHKKQHSELLDQLNTIISSIEDGSQIISMTTMTFLRDWLRYHFQGSDRQFAAFLDNKGLL